MADRLVEIGANDLQNLKNLYKSDGSKSYIAYMTIDNYLQWFQQDPNIKHVRIFCLNGDYSDGTFVITDRCHAYADTFNASHEKLDRLLRLIDYSKGYTFISVRPELRPVIKNALIKANVEDVVDDEVLMYYLPKEDALQMDVQPPKDISLRPVTDYHDLEKVNSVWPLKDANSFPFLQRLAKYNSNVGAYKEDGTLVAWIFRFPTGAIATLQTDDKYYGQGYAALVLRYLSKKIAEMGHDLYAPIFETNTPSRSLFSKLGYKPITTDHWVTSKLKWSPADE